MLSLEFMLPGLRRHRDHPLRLVLILSGVALGAALVTSIILVNRATLRSFKASVDDLAGATDLIVTSLGGQSFPEETLDRVLDVKGVSSAVPVVQNKTYIRLDRDASHSMTIPMTLLGIDLLNDSSVRSKDDKGLRIVKDPLAFMADPKSIALTRTFADQNKLKQGDTIQVVTTSGIKHFKVGALIDGKGPGKAFGGTLMVADIEAARLAFGKSGKTDQINVAIERNGDLRDISERIRTSLGESYTIDPPSSQIQGLREAVAPFQQLLGFLGLLACFLAFFLISSIARVSIAERRSEIGVLRALGMEKSRLLAIILSEYLLIGLVGAAVGSFSASVLATLFSESIQQGLALESQTVIDFKGSVMSLAVPLLITLGGALTTALAVLAPVWMAARISPIEAITLEKTGEQDGASGPGSRILFVIGCASLAPLLFPAAAQHRFLHLAPLIGAIICAPIFAVGILKTTRAIGHRVSSPLLSLAWSYAIDKPKRVEKMIRGLIIGLVVIFVIASVQNGFMEGLAGKYIHTSRPDFYVTSNGSFNSIQTLQPIDDRIQKELETVPGVRGVFGLRIVDVRYGSHLVKMNAYDEVPPDTFEVPYSYFQVMDRQVADAGRELYHGDPQSIMVSESFTSLYGKKTGDVISLQVLDRTMPFRIVGVVRDFSAGGGWVYIARAHYKALWKDSLVTGIAFVLKKGANLDDVKNTVETRFAAANGLIITVDRGNKEKLEALLRRSFLGLYCVELVCILVATLGFISSFLIEIQNRARELAILRLVGMSKKELSVFLATEAVLLGIGAGVASVVFASPVSWSLVSRSLPKLFGWVIEFSLGAGLCLATLGLGIFIPLFSSLYSIRWATRLDVVEANQSE